MPARAAAAVVQPAPRGRLLRLVRSTLLVLVVQPPAPLDRCSLKLLREHLPAVAEAQRRARLVRALLGLAAQLALPDQCSQISLRARMRAVVAPCLRAEMQCMTTNWPQAATSSLSGLLVSYMPLARRGFIGRFCDHKRSGLVSPPVGRPSHLSLVDQRARTPVQSWRLTKFVFSLLVDQ